MLDTRLFCETLFHACGSWGLSAACLGKSRPDCHCAPASLGWQVGQAQQGQLAHPAGSLPEVSRKTAIGFPLASQRTRVLGHGDVFWHVGTAEE